MTVYYPNPNFKPSLKARSLARRRPRMALSVSQNRKRKYAFLAKKVRKARTYKPTASFTRQMTKYNNINAEKKIIPMKNYLNGPGSDGYLQDLPCAGLTSAGLTNNALSCLVLQTGSELTNMNAEMNTDSGTTIAYALGGYALTQGTGAGQMLGKYCKLTSTYMNVNITMDPTDYNNEISSTLDNICPHQFRVIQVRARRDKMVAQGVHVNDIGEPSIGYNLFLDEQGKPKGLISDMATQDAFTWFVNKQMWTVVKEERFTLAGNLLSRTTDNPIAISTNNEKYKSSRFKKYWLPKPRNKVRYPFGSAIGSTLEPIDYNFITHTIIICKNTSSGERPSTHWNVQVNGATAFIDE